MIKAVLFDLDGTLLDRDSSVRRFAWRQHERLAHVLGHIPREAYVDRFIQLDERGYVWKDKVYSQLVDEFAIQKITPEQLVEDYLGEFGHSCVSFTHVKETLDELQRCNILLGLITNGRSDMQMTSVRALGIEEYFSVLLISEAEGIKKPDPQIFHRALERLGVRPDESIYVGDHPHNDVEAAKSAGMRSVWKRDELWDEPAEPDAIIDDLLEVIDVTKKWSEA